MSMRPGEGNESGLSRTGQQPWHRMENRSGLQHEIFRRRMLEHTTVTRARFLAVHRRTLSRQGSRRS